MNNAGPACTRRDEPATNSSKQESFTLMMSGPSASFIAILALLATQLLHDAVERPAGTAHRLASDPDQQRALNRTLRARRVLGRLCTAPRRQVNRRDRHTKLCVPGHRVRVIGPTVKLRGR